MKVLHLFVLLSLTVSLFAQANKPATAKPKASVPPAKTKQAAPAKTVPAPAAVTESKADAKAVLTVGDEKVTAEQFEAFVQALPEQYRAQALGPKKRQVAQDLVRVKLLAAEARRRGLDKDKATLSRIAFTIDNLLAGAVYNDILSKASIDDARLRKHYDDTKNEWEQADARHVLIRFKGSPVPLRPGQKELSEEEALAKTQELRKKVLAGEDFAAIAKAESDDTGSGANGGGLGSFKRGSMVPAFDQVAFTLPVGELSEPVKTQFGYHIIKVDKRDIKTFEESKPEIENKLRPEMARGALESMLTNANVVYDEAYFGPAQEPAAPKPAADKPVIRTQPNDKK